MNDELQGIHGVPLDEADFVVLDILTVGPSPGRGSIFEIALLRFNSAGDIQDQFQSLIFPEHSMEHLGEYGLTQNHLAKAPRIADVAGHVLKLMSGSILVAHSIYTDLKVLRKELLAPADLNAEIPHVCTMYLRGLLGLDPIRVSLEVACRAEDIPYEEETAMANAEAAATLFLAYLRRAKEQGAVTFDDFSSDRKRLTFMDSWEFTPPVYLWSQMGMAEPFTREALGEVEIKEEEEEEEEEEAKLDDFDPHSKDNTAKKGRTIKCPGCGHAVPRDTRVCPLCACPITSTRPAAAGSGNTVEEVALEAHPSSVSGIYTIMSLLIITGITSAIFYPRINIICVVLWAIAIMNHYMSKRSVSLIITNRRVIYEHKGGRIDVMHDQILSYEAKQTGFRVFTIEITSLDASNRGIVATGFAEHEKIIETIEKFRGP